MFTLPNNLSKVTFTVSRVDYVERASDWYSVVAAHEASLKSASSVH